jgi:hypothetical protein
MLATYVGQFGQERVRHDSHKAIDDSSGGDQRMALKVTGCVRVVDICRVGGEVHEEVHD